MFQFNNNFCNTIAQLSIKKFNDLPKTGKPNLEEWTILSCIAKHDNVNNDLEIIALGTGSKCIGANKMSPKGDVLNDSHAEIICRRAFLRYLYSEIARAINEEIKSIFIINEKNKFMLRKNLTFHFFSTHVPCGDAAIFPKQNSEDFGNCITLNEKLFEQSNKRPLEADDKISEKKRKIESDSHILKDSEVNTNDSLSTIATEEEEQDIFRTGAKCLTNDMKQDSKLSGLEYHTLGAVRTKPGRGDPTLSVSCSDKFAKWSILGLQGALLSYFLAAPIYLTSLTIAGNVPFSEESLLRSLKTRFNANITFSDIYHHTTPAIGQADITFQYCKNEFKRPCPSSIIWSNVSVRPLEISVEGKKQGVTKKNRNKKDGRLLVCKKELFASFMNIITSCSKLNLDELKSVSYRQVKKQSEYYKVWSIVKSNVFKIWTVKNEELLNFTADE